MTMDQRLANTFAQNRIINSEWHNFINQFDVDAIKKGYLPSATFELTAFCTLKCPMCYVRIDKERADVLGRRPCTGKEWIDLARQFRDQGGMFLLLTGGEAMLRPDFPEIYTEISKMGLYITLFTNGTTVDDRMLEVLEKRPPAMVGITLYGASEETYRKFGGSEGSFQRAVDGLDRLLTISNLVIDVRFTACNENYKDFKAVYELVANRNKLISFDVGSCAPVRGAVSDARKLRLSNEQLKEVNGLIKEISKPILEEYEKLKDGNGNNKEKEQSDYILKLNFPDERGLLCKGGKNSVYIAWDGRMYPCDMASYPYTFPLEQGFNKAAEDIRHQIDALLLPERCITCFNKNVICTCIPKALNEMKDCARTGDKCDYIAIQQA
jgi:MoaA/NifB/PqqE/SkfB family radical SAM enzyme